jgi:hypothetical protein
MPAVELEMPEYGVAGALYVGGALEDLDERDGEQARSHVVGDDAGAAVPLGVRGGVDVGVGDDAPPTLTLAGDVVAFGAAAVFGECVSEDGVEAVLVAGGGGADLEVLAEQVVGPCVGDRFAEPVDFVFAVGVAPVGDDLEGFPVAFEEGAPGEDAAPGGGFAAERPFAGAPDPGEELLDWVEWHHAGM